MTNRYSITTERHGYEGYEAFSDIALVENLETAVISRIVVRSNPYINSITVHYVGCKQTAVTRGGSGVDVNEIVLEKDEWITRIEGSMIPNVISHLKFVSSTGKTWGPFGTSGGKSFVLDSANNVSPHLASRMGLLYFQGGCDTSYIYLLQATFAEYPGIVKPPGMLKFEKQTGAESIVHYAGTLSSFARQLMSPIIILRIGPDNVEFRAYEDILCRLSFFRAALQGGFKEASEKTITMPEDEPETIAALIEFLSTGSYTYTFKPNESSDPAETTGIPVCDATQGIFHVAVYATASKYDCEELVEASVRNFTYVLKQLKGLDVISLWKTAYLKGLYLSQFEADEDLQLFMKGLQRLVADAYRTHREEMESMVSESPALASDLLRLIATGGGV